MATDITTIGEVGTAIEAGLIGSGLFTTLPASTRALIPSDICWHDEALAGVASFAGIGASGGISAAVIQTRALEWWVLYASGVSLPAADYAGMAALVGLTVAQVQAIGQALVISGLMAVDGKTSTLTFNNDDEVFPAGCWNPPS